MAINDLALSWKDHHGVLISVFEKLLEKKSLVDCTLAAEGKFLKAHKIVLSACSPYLEALLNQENDKHPIIFLRDVQYEDLKTLVEFVYSGEIRIPEDRLIEFLSVAEALQIKGLGGTENEGSLKKQAPLPEPLPAARRENSSPVPRKRPRRHSSEKEGKRPRERESSPDISVIEPSPPPPPLPPPPPPPPSRAAPSETVSRHSSETQLHVSNFRGVPSPSTSSSSSSSQNVPPAVSTVREEILPDVRKVKEEIVNSLTGVSVSLRSDPEHGPTDSTSEEILGLKPEFEQVTFTEDYSDDMLPEDDNSEEPVIHQSQPSSSQHDFSEFTAEPVDPRGMEVASFMEGSEEHPASEGLSTFVVDRPSELRHQAIPESMEDSSLGNYSEEAGEGSISRQSTSVCGPEKLICQYCFKRMASPSALKIHESWHTGNKLYECTVCSMRFVRKYDLQKHFQRHTGERPFQCENCGKTFYRNHHLKVHLLSQTCRGGMCPICQIPFKCLGMLERHLKIHSR